MSGYNSKRSPPANDALQAANGTASTSWQNHFQDVANAAFGAASATNPVLTGGTTLNGTNGTSKLIQFTTGNALRWDLGVADNAEANNGGSDFILRRYNDAGALASVELTISRQFGTWNFTAPVAFAQPVGFFGAAPVAQPVVRVSGTNTQGQVNGIIAALVALGLVQTS